MMGKRLIYAKITCVAGLSLFSFTSNTVCCQSFRPIVYPGNKFRYLSATVRRQSAISSIAMFTSALGLLQTDLPDQNFIMYVLFRVLLPIYHKTPAR